MFLLLALLPFAIQSCGCETGERAASPAGDGQIGAWGDRKVSVIGCVTLLPITQPLALRLRGCEAELAGLGGGEEEERH